MLLTALVAHLRGKQVREGLAATPAIEFEWARAQTLRWLAPYLSGKHVGRR